MPFESARDEIVASNPLSCMGLVVFQPTVQPKLGRSVAISQLVVAKAARPVLMRSLAWLLLRTVCALSKGVAGEMTFDL
jgi:hypothetical protein